MVHDGPSRVRDMDAPLDEESQWFLDLCIGAGFVALRGQIKWKSIAGEVTALDKA